jgi:hypothetical protein
VCVFAHQGAVFVCVKGVLEIFILTVDQIFISKLIMVFNRFCEILQKWQQLKEKIHTTKVR